MDNIFLVFSIILNIFFAIIVFFKTSLNEIVTEWVKSLIHSRQQKKEKLSKIHSLVKKLPTTGLIVLVELASFRDGQAKQLPKKTNYLDEWNNINNEIENNELLLPNLARKEYRELREKMKSFGSEITRSGTS